MEHHVALPPDAMGKITYIAPAGQYSLKVGMLLLSAYPIFMDYYARLFLNFCNVGCIFSKLTRVSVFLYRTLFWNLSFKV